MTGFTLVVIRVETVADALPKDFDFEVDTYAQRVQQAECETEKDERRLIDRSSVERRSSSPAPHPSSASSVEALDVDSTPLAVLRGQRKVEELRIETYDSANFRIRVMDESEEGDETVATPPPSESRPPLEVEPSRDDVAMSTTDSGGGFDDEEEDFEVEDQEADSSSSSPSRDNQNIRMRDPRTNRLSPNSVVAWKQSSPSSSTTQVVPPAPAPPPYSLIHYYCGNPMVEVAQGILHLYKTKLPSEERSEMVCMLSVPAMLTIHDLLSFMSHVTDGLEHIKIIRDSTPNQYMTLLKFKNQTLADEFYSNYNSVPYNSIEDHLCQLAYVAKVESVKETEGACLPIPGCTELPTCPVCLERMDESVKGILTILCNHSFHSECLQKWGDTTCPVCRYCQAPELSQDNKCFECGSQESLWICLICGHVGCGRYVAGHAFHHFTLTQHCYSMQLGNNRVWDYAGDNYVHRLVQNKSDGKLIEVDESGNVVQEGEKLDSITLEYTYLLTSQLESQRLYFEEKMNLVESEARSQVEEMEKETRNVIAKYSEIEDKLTSVTKDKTTLETKSSKLSTKLGGVLRELQEEKTLNTNLRENQSLWQKKVEDLEARLKRVEEERERETQDLKEQLRDVMFYLEGQKQLEDAEKNLPVTQEEIEGGQITIGAEGGALAKARRKKKR